MPVTAGPITINFIDANNGSMTYTVDGVTQTKLISRLAFPQTSKQVSTKTTSFGVTSPSPIKAFEGRLQRGTICPTKKMDSRFRGNEKSEFNQRCRSPLMKA